MNAGSSIASTLVGAGVRVVGGSSHEIKYIHNGAEHTAEIVRYERLPRTLPLPTDHRRLLVAARTATTRARELAAARHDVDLVISEPHEVTLLGHSYARTIATPTMGRGTKTSLADAIERVLILSQEQMTQLEIATAVGTSQPNISRTVRRYSLPMVLPLATADRAKLLDEVIARHSPIIEETSWYGLATPSKQAAAVIEYAGEMGVDTLVSGEVAADALRPWRVPAHTLVYASELFDVTDANLVAADAQNSTLTLRAASDPTIFATAHWWATTREDIIDQKMISTVDPVVALTDLAARPDIGDGAADRLKDWIIAGAR